MTYQNGLAFQLPQRHGCRTYSSGRCYKHRDKADREWQQRSLLHCHYNITTWQESAVFSQSVSEHIYIAQLSRMSHYTLKATITHEIQYILSSCLKLTSRLALFGQLRGLYLKIRPNQMYEVNITHIMHLLTNAFHIHVTKASNGHYSSSNIQSLDA